MSGQHNGNTVFSVTAIKFGNKLFMKDLLTETR